MLFAFAAAMPCLLSPVSSSAGEETAAAATHATASSPSGKAGSILESPGRKIYIDPATGQKAPAPAVAAPSANLPAVTNRTSTSSEGLIETPVTEKAGGFKVHLNGRFHANLTVTNRPDGKVITRCVSGPEELLKSQPGTQSTGALPKR